MLAFDLERFHLVGSTKHVLMRGAGLAESGGEAKHDAGLLGMRRMRALEGTHLSNVNTGNQHGSRLPTHLNGRPTGHHPISDKG